MDLKHQGAVKKLQDQIRGYYAHKTPFRVFHGSTNSTKVLTFKRSEMVDTSKLNRVISVDKTKKVAVAEPNVPMDALIKATLKSGLVPPVVPEFPGITVGGAIQGAAAETTSHRWGCFSQTVNWVEMILGNGEQVKASPGQKSDLFYGTAGSYGSLGLLTAAELQLIPAKKYVVITNHPVSSCKEGMELINKSMKAGNDFIEFVLFKKDLGVVTTGNMSDKSEGKLRRFSRPFDPWYYMYLQKAANAKKQTTDSLPLKDYLFRHNRGAFWTAQLAFEQSGIPFNALTRFILDPFLRTRKLYQALQESAAAQVYLCQDLVIPDKNLPAFVDYIDKTVDKYPIGLCPIKPEPRSPLQCNGIDAKLVYNVGVYGLRVDSHKKFVEINKSIEAETQRLGGKKWFYAHSYYTKEEFWRIYDKKWYTALRKKYHATTLPDIYSRISVDKLYSVSKKRGALKMMFGRAKLRVTE